MDVSGELVDAGDWGGESACGLVHSRASEEGSFSRWLKGQKITIANLTNIFTLKQECHPELHFEGLVLPKKERPVLDPPRTEAARHVKVLIFTRTKEEHLFPLWSSSLRRVTVQRIKNTVYKGAASARQIFGDKAREAKRRLFLNAQWRNSENTHRWMQRLEPVVRRFRWKIREGINGCTESYLEQETWMQRVGLDWGR